MTVTVSLSDMATSLAQIAGMVAKLESGWEPSGSPSFEAHKVTQVLRRGAERITVIWDMHPDEDDDYIVTLSFTAAILRDPKVQDRSRYSNNWEIANGKATTNSYSKAPETALFEALFRYSLLQELLKKLQEIRNQETLLLGQI